MNTDVRELRDLYQQASDFVGQHGWMLQLPVTFSTSFTPDRAGAIAFELCLESADPKVRISLKKTYTDSRTAKTLFPRRKPDEIRAYFQEQLADPAALNSMLIEAYVSHFEYERRPDDMDEYHQVHRRSSDDLWFEHSETKRRFRKTANDNVVLVRRFDSDHEKEISPDDPKFSAVSADPNRAISEAHYWSERHFDAVFGVESGLSAQLQTTASPNDITSFLDSKPGDGVVSVDAVIQRTKDLPNPVFFDGFSEDVIHVTWHTSDGDEQIYSEILSQAFQLSRWEEITFGAVWVGKRPTIVWDGTGLHIIVDDDFTNRLPGSLLLNLAKQKNLKFRTHPRDVHTIPDEISKWEQSTPTPKPKLVQQVEWVETLEPATPWGTYLTMQESADAVLAVVKNSPGQTIYAIDQAVHVPRLHLELRLPDILDHLEKIKDVRSKPGKKSKKLYYPS